jgi:ppGpp synthetase/RelA/SpoT-type nucleotidyltranferase
MFPETQAMAAKSPPITKARIEQVLRERLPVDLCEQERFDDWYEPLKDAVAFAVTRVHTEVVAALEAERLVVLGHERLKRDVWQIFPKDHGALTKSASSIRSKIGRELCERIDSERALDGRLSEDQLGRLVLGFPDLGRFRVICDFPPDVARAQKALVPNAKKGLLACYPLKGGRIKDYVFDLELRRPTSGHRAKQFAVRVDEAGEPAVWIEIQLMTPLQHAWDQRNHLLYEWMREGGELTGELRVNDLAVAETMHLADQQAARNWEMFVKERKRALARRTP